MLLVKLIEPPCTERYARWCERSEFLSCEKFLLLDCDKHGECKNEIFGIVFDGQRKNLGWKFALKFGIIISYVDGGFFGMNYTGKMFILSV